MPLPRVKSPKGKKQRRPKAAAWIRLQELEDLGGLWCAGEIINLHGWKTLKYKETEHDVLILAELTTEIEGTCNCGEPAANFKFWGYTDPTFIRDLPIRHKRTRIYFRLQRKRCNNPECDKRKTFQQPLIEVHERYSITTRLLRYIEQASFFFLGNFSRIAEETGTNESTIRNIFTSRAKHLEENTQRLKKIGIFETPEWIAIDEVYPRKHGGEYCVITAPANQQVLDILPVNKEKELFKWLLQLPKRHEVKVVTIDMCVEYRSILRRLLPQALIVVDRYHVHNLLNVALKEVLEVIRASMTSSENHEFMRPEFLLLTSYRRLSEEEKEDEHGVKQPSPKQLADTWLKEVPDLAIAHSLKEEFFDILQLTDRQKAEKLTDLWLEKVIDFVDYFRAKYEKNFGEKWPDPFGNVPNTVVAWRDSILNYIDCKHRFKGKLITNSFAEFTNGQIKKAYRMGNNLSYEVLRLKVVYGGVIIKRRPPHPLDEKKPRRTRRRITRPNKLNDSEKNPTANLALMKKAREDGDETRNLLPNPQSNPEWTSRFEPIERDKLNSEIDVEAPDPETIEHPHTDDEDQHLKSHVARARRQFRFKPAQIKLF
jgi:transposase